MNVIHSHCYIQICNSLAPYIHKMPPTLSSESIMSECGRKLKFSLQYNMQYIELIYSRA